MSNPTSAHLVAPPDRAFWCDTLCFEGFDDVLARCDTAAAADAIIASVIGHSGGRRTADSIIADAGGGLAPRQNVALALTFLRHRRSQAVEDAAAAFFTGEEIDEHRSSAGKVRRHELALCLFVVAPESLLGVDLWDQWHARRGARYRMEPALTTGIDVDTTNWQPATQTVLAVMAGRALSGCDGFEPPVVFHGAEGDVLLGFREWPKREAVRSEGRVITGDVATWMLVRVYAGGDRIDVTDSVVDRGAALASALVQALRPGASEYEQVLNELPDEVIDTFLDAVTAEDDDTFPLVEITAELPWDVRHRSVTLRGTATATVEPIVTAMRELGPFAVNWRTVKSVKLLFEGAYKIEVHFPVAGHHRAISYSDVDRDKRVTRRFAEMLNRALRHEVAPKARRGSRVPRRREEQAPRVRSAEWWGRLLVAKHDRPAAWVEQALGELANVGLIHTTQVGVLSCGSPYLDRPVAGTAWAECKGEVELPLRFDDLNDPCQPEDDGSYECSEHQHRWRPVRYRLPVDLRVKVELDHAAAWRLLLNELAHYGDVELEPGRSGVASVRLAQTRAYLVYLPLADAADRSPEAFPRAAAAWVIPPMVRAFRSSPTTVDLASVFAGDDVLGPAWDVSATRRRIPHSVTLALAESEVSSRVIELIGPREIRVGGRLVAEHRPAMYRVAHLLHLADVSEGERRARPGPWLVELAKKHEILAQTAAESHLHVMVARARDAVDGAVGVPGRGGEAFVTDGAEGYRLGDGWEVRMRTERAAHELKG